MVNAHQFDKMISVNRTAGKAGKVKEIVPNWCSNIIRIRGANAEQVDAVLNAILDQDRSVDFNKLILRPDILNHTAHGSTEIEGRTYKSWYVEKTPEGEISRAFTEAEKAELDAIGFADWYGWSIHNWGTKWNASGTEIDDMNKEYGEADIRFETAWSPPIPVLDALKFLFPDVDIETRYRNEDDDEYPHAS